MNGVRKILVPADFSAHTGEAFQVAQTLALTNGADVILFHVARAPAVVPEEGRLLVNPANGERPIGGSNFIAFSPLTHVFTSSMK
jgi:nucleotide-binding universal stress UspA family protein